jgi:hypothetical protein
MELDSVGQPGGLSDGSRWSFRATGKTTTGKACRMVQHPGEGCQTQPHDASSILWGNANLEHARQQRVWHPAGVQELSCAATRRSPP